MTNTLTYSNRKALITSLYAIGAIVIQQKEKEFKITGISKIIQNTRLSVIRASVSILESAFETLDNSQAEETIPYFWYIQNSLEDGLIEADTAMKDILDHIKRHAINGPS